MRRLYKLLGLIGTLTLVGSLLGYARNASITSVFGLSGNSDAYFVAVFIPMTLQAILVLGALAPALVHVYVNYVESGQQREATVTFSTVLNLTVVFIAGLVVAGLLFSRQVVNAIAPGLSEESAQLAADLMRYTLPVLLFVCVGSLIGPILNTKGHFFVPAVNTIVVNVLTIAFIIIGGKTIGIETAAIGLLVGNAAHVALLILMMRRRGIGYLPVLQLGHRGVRRVLTKTLPVIAYMVVGYSASILERLLASTQGEGSISIITIAITVYMLPLLVFNGPMGVILYPDFVRFAANARAQLSTAMMQAARLIIVVMLPATLLLVASAGPLTRLAYGPSSVSGHDIRIGSAVLAAYALALTAIGMTQLLQKGIYAAGDFSTPLKIELFTIGLYATAAIAMCHVWSIVGLALARAAHHVITTCVTFWMVRHVAETPSPRRLALFALKPLAAGVVAVAFYGVGYLAVYTANPSPSYLLLAIEQGALLLASGCVYLMAASLLRVEEVRILWRVVPAMRPPRPVTREAV